MMKMIKPRNIAIAVATTLSIGSASQALAAPTFTIDLSAILGGASAEYTGDFFAGTSTERLTTSGDTHEGSGWLQISSLSLNAVSVAPFGIDAFSPLNLYVTFTLKDKLKSGTMNTAGSIYTLTELNFVVWGDASKDTKLVNAQVGGTGPSVTDVSGDDVALGFGSLISGEAGLNASGGAYLNSTNMFGVCSGNGTGDVGGTSVANSVCKDDTGVNFFVDPVPFYELAFTEFNNTSQGFAIDGTDLVINSASGGVDFNKVPEPASLALLGAGFLAAFGAKRRAKV